MAKPDPEKLIADIDLTGDEDPEQLTKVMSAALMRAKGKKWGEVADALGYSAPGSAWDLCKRRYKDQFAQAFHKIAKDYYLGEVEPTAVATQMDIIRRYKGSDDPKMLERVSRAAHSLMTHTSKIRKLTIKLETKNTHEIAQADRERIDAMKNYIEDFMKMQNKKGDNDEGRGSIKGIPEKCSEGQAE